MSDRLGSGQPDYWRELFESLIGQRVTMSLLATSGSGSSYFKGVVVRPGANFVEGLLTWVDGGRAAQAAVFIAYNSIVMVTLEAKWAGPPQETA